MKIRAPKTLSDYTTAEDAADGLEHLASMIRGSAKARPWVRWSINLSFWNDIWNTSAFTGDRIVRSVSYHNNPRADHAEPTAQTGEPR